MCSVSPQNAGSVTFTESQATTGSASHLDAQGSVGDERVHFASGVSSLKATNLREKSMTLLIRPWIPPKLFRERQL